MHYLMECFEVSDFIIFFIYPIYTYTYNPNETTDYVSKIFHLKCRTNNGEINSNYVYRHSGLEIELEFSNLNDSSRHGYFLIIFL